MKRILFAVALATTVMITGSALAEKPEKRAQRNRADATEGRRRPPRDPAKMVARIMTEFDQDGDEKLDKTELAAWLKAMQERRGPGMRGGKGRLGGKGKGPRSGDGQGRPGGEVPIRPDAE